MKFIKSVFLFFILNLLNGQDIDESSWILADININSESHHSLINDYDTPINASFYTNSEKNFFSTSPCDTSTGEIIFDKENSKFTFLIFGTTLGGCTGESGDKWQLLQKIVLKHDDFFNFFHSGTSFSYQIIEENMNHPKTLVITNSNGDYVTYFINVLSFSNEKSDFSFSIYPNPVKQNLFINSKLSVKHSNYDILDISGKSILSGVFLDKKFINTNILNEGIYFIKIHTTNGVQATRKFIKI